MRLAFALCALVAAAVPARAGTELYIFDVLHRPEWASSYNRMMRGEKGIPAWFATANSALRSTTTPASSIQVGGRTEDLFKLCQPHQCADNTLAVLFSDGGERSVAAFYNGNAVRYFGNPTEAERSALGTAAQGGI